MQPRNSRAVRGGNGRYGAVRGGRRGVTPTAPYRAIPPLTARRRRTRQHSHREPHPPPSRQPARDPRDAQRAGQRVDQPREPGGRQGGERRAGEPGKGPRDRDQLPRRFEPVAVADARGAHRLAAATAEAAIEVLDHVGVVGRELPALEGTHQLDAAARAVGLVAGREERGARLETEAAVDAGVERRESAARLRDGVNRHGPRFRPRPRSRFRDRRCAAGPRRAGPRLRGRRRSGPRRGAAARRRVPP